MSKRYRKSEELLAIARQSIPLGSQTYSKSYTQYPYGISPYFIDRGKGCYVWDVDGNRYLDMVNSLAAVTLGYSDDIVNQAVREQLERGTIFSLPSTLEMKVAELIIELVPCAEMVRFGKNGSDATSGAIRLARAYTGRSEVLVCGYHGWHDWYIGTTNRDLGILKDTSRHSSAFQFNDISSLEKILSDKGSSVAAIIIEPMNVEYPKPGFLHEVKRMASASGALLIFDETVTGFRFALGGAQEKFNVVPDLATFGKGLANGFPLSAIAGRKEIMTLFEDVFFSFTFGGDTLSLAAAQAVITRLKTEPILETIEDMGNKLLSRVNELINRFDLNEVLELSGHPSWSFLLFKSTNDYDALVIKTYFMQEVFQRGVLALGSHNLSYSFGEQELDKLCSCYEEVFQMLSAVLRDATLLESLRSEVLQPLFSVR